MQGPLRLSIEKHGQPYVDQLVYVNPRSESLCEKAVREACGRELPRRIAVGFNRTPLNWNNKHAAN